MSKEYIVIVAASLLVATSAAAGAQSDEGHDHERGDRASHRRMPGRGFDDPSLMIERMAEHLELDDVQRQSIANIMDAAKPQFEALRSRSLDNRDAIRALDVTAADYGTSLRNLASESGELAAELTLLTGRLRADVAGILTDEQRAIMEDRLNRMGERWRRISADRAR